jgi:hypothetical protein
MRRSRHIKRRQLAFGLGMIILSLALVPPRSIAQTAKSEDKARPAPTPASFEGCYELKLGRWWPWGFGEENAYVTPPSRIQLLEEHGTRGFEQDNLLIRTIPRQDRPPRSRESSFWSAKSQSQLVLTWTDGFVGVSLDLAKNKGDLTGWAHPHFDAVKIIPRIAHVKARRTTCEPDTSASDGGEAPPHSPVQQGASPIAAPNDWHRLDAGPFSILAPSAWEFRQLVGVDSYVGEFVGNGLVLTFDFGGYSNPLKEEKGPAYVVVYKSIGGRRAKIVGPKTPGQGITGVYFRNAGYSSALTLFARDLTSTQQQLVLEIFETLRFGGPAPRYVLPPPPAKKAQ